VPFLTFKSRSNPIDNYKPVIKFEFYRFFFLNFFHLLVQLATDNSARRFLLLLLLKNGPKLSGAWTSGDFLYS
jgi:hypothetical protein